MVDRQRYAAYRAVRESIALEGLSDHSSGTLCDFAEGLLLARGRVEGEEVRDSLPAVLMVLVDRGDLPRCAADRFWADVRACGPRLVWPASWDGHSSAPAGWAVRGH
jgi:hypothetical protein